jgi:hypothetical protein
MRKISGFAALAVLAVAGLVLATSGFESAGSSPAHVAPMSDSERRVEQCISSGGDEEACTFEEMKRTLLVNES